MKKTILLLVGLAAMTIANQAQTITDYDGNVYDTVTIGTQVWMKQNLKTTHDIHGTLIPNVTDSLAWSSLSTPARCYYNNDSAAFDSVFGPLYNWYMANDTDVCPSGYHVPTNAEWIALENYLGGAGVAGGPMKETDTLHWASPNTAATNSSGFTGLPGGGRDNTGKFSFIYENGLWWTSTSYNFYNAWGLYLWYLSPGVEHDPVFKKYGVSIRCIKNTANGLEDINDVGLFKLFPNPVKDKLYMELRQNSEIEFQNMQGQIIKRFKAKDINITIDISDFAKGVYVIKVTNEKGIVVKRFVKE